jgi:sugar/nucleoside kinase (ribokinase family)
MQSFARPLALSSVHTVNTPDLIVVGEVMVDVRGPAGRSGTRTHGSIRLRAGGTAVNAALAAASIGARVSVVARVGDDGAGRLVRDALEAAGVGYRLVHDEYLPTGTFVELGETIVADRGANAALALADIPLPLSASAVLLSPYLPEDLARAVVRAADARWIAGPGGNVYVGHDPPEAAYEVVCTTFGEYGAVAMRGPTTEFHAPPAAVEGSATGAGDAFAAGFLVELGRGRPLDACLRRGCSLGYAIAVAGAEA